MSASAEPHPTSNGSNTNRPIRPHYAAIHAQSLPVETHPLPAFHPSHPLSLLRLAYVVLSSALSNLRNHSHPEPRYVGVLSPSTRAVHVTDPATVRALWERGFFGKGSLSRSEPEWLSRERRRRWNESTGLYETSEEVTRRRREARRFFKTERARKVNEAIEEQLRKEGKADPSTPQHHSVPQSEKEDGQPQLAVSLPHNIQSALTVVSGPVDRDIPDVCTVEGTKAVQFDQSLPKAQAIGRAATQEAYDDLAGVVDEVKDEEHLQLTFEEAFFLSYGLGVLQVTHADNSGISHEELLRLFSGISHNIHVPTSPSIKPDESFLVRYAAYHHFRSLGWVVRSGVKFAVDLLLYHRGPVFAHAEFAVILVPVHAQSGPDEAGLAKYRSWWWLHCVNRVQAHVLKHLVLAYVDVPSAAEVANVDAGSIGAMLGKYRVREFILRRWNPNRSRD